MGRRILELAFQNKDLEIAGAFDLPSCSGEGIQLFDTKGNSYQQFLGASVDIEMANAHVLIDFSHAEACLTNVETAWRLERAAVVGTTGLSPEQVAQLQEYAAAIPIVYAPNMSIGVNLLFKLTMETAKQLGLDYNVEITEIHHNQKKDSPSGTAIRLAEQAAAGMGLDYPADAVFGREGMVGARPERQIGVHALRGGDVVGEHTVSFIGCGERIELTHKAHSRDNFARGALRAAIFAAAAAPGLYDMQDVLNLK